MNSTSEAAATADITADITLHTMIFRLGWTPRGVDSPSPACHHFAEPPASARREAASEVALAGRDGQRAADLLAASKRAGTDLLASITERAVRRLLAMGPHAARQPVLFNDDELKQLAESLGATIATADLLGRSRVRRFASKYDETKATQFAEPGEFDPFDVFAEPVPFQPPAEATGYFQRLVPSLAADPYRYGALLERHAFTLSVATDQALLDKVKRAINERLIGLPEGPNGERSLGTATADIQDILDAAGVAPANPQYAEMVFRTNMMDAYNAGQTAEMATPEMREMFPWWRYEGVIDSRTGDDHLPKINKYYPASAIFSDVRGPRVWNCRCGHTPLWKGEVAELQAAGARVETTW